MTKTFSSIEALAKSPRLVDATSPSRQNKDVCLFADATRTSRPRGFAIVLAATAAALAGCATPPPPPPAVPVPVTKPAVPAPTVVYMGVRDADPMTEAICGHVADGMAKRGELAVTRAAGATPVRATVLFGFKAVEKARLDDWYVFTGVLTMKAVAHSPSAGEVVIAEETVKVDGERKLGRAAAIKALVQPLQAAADKWVNRNVTKATIRKFAK